MKNNKNLQKKIKFSIKSNTNYDFFYKICNK